MPKMDVKTRFEKFIMPITETGCWIWMGHVGTTGYGGFSFKGACKKAPRVAYELFKGPIPKGMDVCHKCDERLCVNPDHLFVGTRKENMQDAIKKGRAVFPPHNKGEHHPNHKLTTSQVESILADKRTYHEIAADYGVHFSTIGYIKIKKNWAHI